MTERRLRFSLALVLIFASGAAAKDKSTIPLLRWDEGKPGCTFKRGDDGRYYYAIWTDDLGITMAIDSQELQMLRQRVAPALGVLLSFRYRGKSTVYVPQNKMSLQFLDHSKIVKTSLDPNDLTKKINDNTDALNDETERELRKHPDRKEELETRAQAYLKTSAEFLEFVSNRSLPNAKLDAANPDANGWVFFSAQDRWIASWKRQESLVLRIPFPDRVFEFPFKLPPEKGDLILRKRE